MAGRGVAGSVVRIVASSLIGFPSASGVAGTISSVSITWSSAYAGIGTPDDSPTISSKTAARAPRMWPILLDCRKYFGLAAPTLAATDRSLADCQLGTGFVPTQ